MMWRSTPQSVLPTQRNSAATPPALENLIQTAPIELRFDAHNLTSFTSRNNDAVTIRIIQRLIEIEQISTREHRRTLVALERARSYS